MLCSQHSAFDGRVFSLEATALRDAGYKVTIVAPRYKDEPKFRDGIRVITYEKSKNRYLRKFHTQRTLLQLACSIDTDYYHVQDVDAPLVAAAYAKKMRLRKGQKPKLIFDSHEVWPYFYPWLLPDILHHPVKHMVLAYEDIMVNRFVDGVITAHDIEEHYYLWLDPHTPVQKVMGGPPLAEWGKPPEKKGPIEVIGHDGYFMMARGMDVILGGFEIVAKEYPSLNFLIAGEIYGQEDFDWIEAWKKRTGLGGRLDYRGWVDRAEIHIYLDMMDISVVGNRGDVHSIRCWPANKMMYYLGRGLPVVSTPNPLYKRFIERNRCGAVAKDYTPEAMADAMRQLLENPKETRKMGKRGYQLAKDNFSWEKSREALLSFYEEMENKEVKGY